MGAAVIPERCRESGCTVRWEVDPTMLMLRFQHGGRPEAARAYPLWRFVVDDGVYAECWAWLNECHDYQNRSGEDTGEVGDDR